MIALKILAILLSMHLIGSCVLAGTIMGPSSFFGGIVLSVFGYYFIPLELFAIFAIWAAYNPQPKQKKTQTIGMGFLAGIIGAIFFAVFIPKEENSENLYFLGGFLGGFCALVYAFACIHLMKINNKYMSITSH